MFLSRAVPPSIRDAYNRDTLSGVLGNVMGGFTGPFIGVIARDRLHASATLVGVMTAAPFVGNLLAMFWANAMEGKRKLPFVVWSMAGARAMFLVMIFATTARSFAVIVCLASLFSTVAGPAYASVMRDIYPKRVRGRAMAYVRVCTAAAAVLSAAVAGPLLDRVSYTVIFPLAAFVGLGSSVVFNSIKTKEVEPVEKTRLHEFLINTALILKDDRPFRWFAMSVFTVGFGSLTVMPLYIIFQVDALHIKATQVSIVANTAAIMAVFAFFYWGPFIDKSSPLKGAAVSVLLVTVTPLTYAFAAHFAFARHWTILLPAAAVQGVANAGVELSYFNSLLRFSPPERVSHYQALFSSLLGVRGAIAPLIGTALVQRQIVEMETLFLAAAALCVVSVLLQVHGTRTHDVR